MGDECLTCVDVHWLAEGGLTAQGIADRLGMDRDTMYRHLLRHGQEELLHGLMVRRGQYGYGMGRRHRTTGRERENESSGRV